MILKFDRLYGLSYKLILNSIYKLNLWFSFSLSSLVDLVIFYLEIEVEEVQDRQWTRFQGEQVLKDWNEEAR